MTRIAVLTSATGGGGGIAASRIYNSIVGAKEGNDAVDLITTKDFGGPIPTDVACHEGGSNKIFSDTHYTVEFPGYVRSEVMDILLAYDAVNIQWCSYLISLSEIKEILEAGKKVVFTCHDFYYFLGGCHYPHTCTSWQASCIKCPQLDTIRFPDYSPRDNRHFKNQLFAYANAQIVTPSMYLTEMASACLMNATNQPLTIRNPLDKHIFYPQHDDVRRAQARVPKILMIADSVFERRKAFYLGMEAIACFAKKLIANNQTQLPEVIIVGQGSDNVCRQYSELPLPIMSLGRLNTEDLASIYRDTDILFTPSLEDNWPNILVEAYACGARMVVGPGHGCAEFVASYGCGVVAENYEVESLANALLSILTSDKIGDSATDSPNYDRFMNDHDSSLIGKSYYSLLV